MKIVRNVVIIFLLTAIVFSCGCTEKPVVTLPESITEPEHHIIEPEATIEPEPKTTERISEQQYNNSPVKTEEDSSDDNIVEKKLVTKIIDGDTVVIEGGERVRLLGIDTDERGYPCYEPAKQRLEELVFNKEVYLESDGEDKDQYKRYLRYLILDGENINLKLVEEGLAIAYFYPQNVKYRDEIIGAEKEARENEIGCKWSKEVEPVTEEVEPVTEEVEPATEEVEPATEDIVWSELTGDAINACSAKDHIGEEQIIEGSVVNGYKFKDIAVFLNFEKPHPYQCFTAVIWKSNWDEFPENPQDYYNGKTVRVMGKIIEHEGTPEIILEDSSQIEIGE
ncbi:MAG: hypothetical protein AEth_00112 [Candidatus Argoarchaeum ethanivorans]|uniref:TNase-like domain-containing protein n=1 Tax=Candidatus Argoarchaeum ethanivorans TaxID=2608793 RepID=A0A8B3S6R5_9EURY|nr:MAG: hypothetical protein AEth_00112 [Candidatus Argoarchaeum ethanivorans]